MDLYLKSYLASINEKSLSPSDEKKIKTSMENGESYWFYTLKDQRNDIEVTYLFQGINVDGHKKTVLQLSFQYLPSFQAKDEEQEKIEKRLLPQ